MNIQDILNTVRRVEILTNCLVNDTMVGAYLSHFKGRGMDFEELRDYIPGDDVRDIDWNVTYRMGRPFIKRYREERELGIILAVDISASEGFGSERYSKRELAAQVASTLAFSAARSSDKVGLLLFTDRVELFLPPRKGRRHILRVIRDMLFFKPRGQGTHIPLALAHLNHFLHRRSIIFLLSDFLHSYGTESRPGKSGRDMVQEIGLTNTRHDLICIHLYDPRESALPDAGLLTIEDAETGELLEVDSSRTTVRNVYRETNAQRIAELDRALRRAGVDTLRISTIEPFAPILQRFFETRRWRRV
ncbi:MAG: DUF58 domain-containing protein [Candidatus Omnitrophica bacterium]|nr:DUF58 domain-containing protein [Candidatus Omnitrophota bacterium]